MFKLEEYRLRLFGNLHSERRSGHFGRRRGGVAPMWRRAPIVCVLSDLAAAAHGVNVSQCLTVSNLLTIAALNPIQTALLAQFTRPGSQAA
jgi:hypothetical protein